MSITNRGVRRRYLGVVSHGSNQRGLVGRTRVSLITNSNLVFLGLRTLTELPIQLLFFRLAV